MTSLCTQKVLVLGPPPTLFGGMATVVEQMLGLEFGKRYELELLPMTIRSAEKESIVSRVGRHLRQCKKVGRAARNHHNPIVHIHTCSGVTFYRSAIDAHIARRNGSRVILHVHGAAFDRFFETVGPLRRRFISSTLIRADRVVALSEGWKRKLQDISPEAKIVVIENAVEDRASLTKFEHEGPCRLLFLGRMDDWKGVDDLLNACSLLRRRQISMKVILAGPPGTAGDEESLPAKIEQQGLSDVVQYIGSVVGDAKSRCFQQSDVFLLPSHHEGMPIVLLEALSFGVPVIATRVGSVPEILTHRREGLLIPAHHPGRLAAAIKRLIANSDQRETMSRAARALAMKRFCLNRLRDDLVKLYDAMLQPDTVCGHQNPLESHHGIGTTAATSY